MNESSDDEREVDQIDEVEEVVVTDVDSFVLSFMASLREHQINISEYWALHISAMSNLAGPSSAEPPSHVSSPTALFGKANDFLPPDIDVMPTIDLIAAQGFSCNFANKKFSHLVDNTSAVGKLFYQFMYSVAKISYLAGSTVNRDLLPEEKAVRKQRILDVVLLIVEILWANDVAFPINGKRQGTEKAGNMSASVIKALTSILAAKLRAWKGVMKTSRSRFQAGLLADPSDDDSTTQCEEREDEDCEEEQDEEEEEEEGHVANPNPRFSRANKAVLTPSAAGTPSSRSGNAPPARSSSTGSNASQASGSIANFFSPTSQSRTTPLKKVVHTRNERDPGSLPGAVSSSDPVVLSNRPRRAVTKGRNFAMEAAAAAAEEEQVEAAKRASMLPTSRGVDEEEESDDSEDNIPMGVLMAQKRTYTKRKAETAELSESSSEDEEEVKRKVPPQKKQVTKKVAKKNQKKK